MMVLYMSVQTGPITVCNMIRKKAELTRAFGLYSESLKDYIIECVAMFGKVPNDNTLYDDFVSVIHRTNLSLEQEDKIIEIVENCNSLLEQEKGECRFQELIDWEKKRYRDRLIELKREKFM